MQSSIFIQLAAYRDPELLPTINSAIDNAKYPERLRFGVCWQYMPGLDEYLLFPSEISEQVTLVAVPADKVQGVCWARSIAQSLYAGEDYVLSVDSHSRFVKDWDVKLIDELHRCPSDKPVLTTYPAPFKAINHLDKEPIIQLKLGEICDGCARFEGFVNNHVCHQSPISTLLSACGFYFCQGEVNQTIPIDPLLYFNQEEFVHSLKLWTHGFDCFIPTQHFVVHQYGKEKSVFDRAVHWADDSQWARFNQRAQVRLQALLDNSHDPAPGDFPIEQFRLGTKRSADAFFAQLQLTHHKGLMAYTNSTSNPNKA